MSNAAVLACRSVLTQTSPELASHFGVVGSQTLTPAMVSAWIKWASANFNELPQIVQAGQAFLTSQGLAPHWETFKLLGDEVVPLLASSPLFVLPALGCSEDELNLEVSAVYGAHGEIIAQFINLLPVLIQAFQTLWPIIAPFIKKTP